MENFGADTEFRNKGTAEFEKLDKTRSFKSLRNMLQTFVFTLGLMESL